MDKFNAENIYIDRAKLVMNFLGVWLPPKNETIPKKIYRVTMLSLQYLFLVFQMIYVVQVMGDLEAVSQASYLLFTQACLCFKVTIFAVKSDMLQELLITMKSDIFRPESEIHKSIIEKQAARIKRLLLAFMISSQATCGLWALKPLFDDKGNKEFPFLMWMPVGTDKSPHYELGYACQLMTICMSAYMYFGVDSVTLSMVIYGCAQLQVIMEKLLQLKPITKNDRILYRNGGKVQVFDDNYDIFINCIKRHQAVVAFITLVEKSYHSYLFFQLSGSVGLICMSALRILSVDWRSMQFFSILTYVSVMIMMLFVCCSCGHDLTTTSEELVTVLHKCQWYEQDLRFQRALRFAMLRMQRPLVFRAGRYIVLSRQTFVTILRMSYSYFAVLQQAR